MWIVVRDPDTWQPSILKFNTRKEALETINGSNDVTKFLLAEIKPFKVKIDNGVVIAY